MKIGNVLPDVQILQLHVTTEYQLKYISLISKFEVYTCTIYSNVVILFIKIYIYYVQLDVYKGLIIESKETVKLEISLTGNLTIILIQ